ncbi:2'-5' RNA ligase family protein [Streptomyces bluensis]|uniref:2'-5' RNA ligase family protein n=1 Tax=Streptomyces bluensis TaxID=33897 RepID=UPI003333517E
MRAFNFKQGKAPWESGTLLHWYLQVDWKDPRHDTLAQLVTDSNQTLLDAAFPITPVEHCWLHITVDQISKPAHLIGQAERDKLVAEVSHRVATIEPFTVMIGSVLSYSTGCIADTHPDHQLAALHAAARDATRVTLGDAACQYEFGIQHLTTAYAYAEADSDAAQRLLRRVRPSHAPLHINAVHLVDVTADPQAKTITWEDLTRVPLGTAL